MHILRRDFPCVRRPPIAQVGFRLPCGTAAILGLWRWIQRLLPAYPVDRSARAKNGGFSPIEISRTFYLALSQRSVRARTHLLPTPTTSLPASLSPNARQTPPAPKDSNCAKRRSRRARSHMGVICNSYGSHTRPFPRHPPGLAFPAQTKTHPKHPHHPHLLFQQY